MTGFISPTLFKCSSYFCCLKECEKKYLIIFRCISNYFEKKRNVLFVNKYKSYDNLLFYIFNHAYIPIEFIRSITLN